VRRLFFAKTRRRVFAATASLRLGVGLYVVEVGEHHVVDDDEGEVTG
jgi:hypothetical protein